MRPEDMATVVRDGGPFSRQAKALSRRVRSMGGELWRWRGAWRVKAGGEHWDLPTLMDLSRWLRERARGGRGLMERR